MTDMTHATDWNKTTLYTMQNCMAYDMSCMGMGGLGWGWAGLGWASASTVSQLHFCVYYTHLPCVCDRVFAKWPVMYTRCVSLAANTPQYLLSLFLYTDTIMDVYVCVCLRVYVHSRRVTTRHCMLEFDDAEMEQHTMTSHTVIT